MGFIDLPALPVSVIIPTYARPTELLRTLARIAECVPAPSEVLVHVDCGDANSADAIKAKFEHVRVVTASSRQGPGGGRNALLKIARNEFVMSLDDDSYPIDLDFFQTLISEFNAHPNAAVLAARITHEDEVVEPRSNDAKPVSTFVGCGSAYRRSVFLSTRGYIPIADAYGVEEADMALQILDRGHDIVECCSLRVFHATQRLHQQSMRIVGAHIANTALLAVLRYPVRLWGLGFLQVMNRIKYSLLRGHFGGAAYGICILPTVIIRHYKERRSVDSSTVWRARRLAR